MVDALRVDGSNNARNRWLALLHIRERTMGFFSAALGMSTGWFSHLIIATESIEVCFASIEKSLGYGSESVTSRRTYHKA